MDSVPMEEYYNYSVNDNGRLEHYGTAAKDYSTTVLTSKAVDFLRKTKAGRPFFLYFAPIAPHLPAIPAKQDQNKLVDLAPLHSPSFNEADIGDKPWRAWHADMLNAAAQLYQGDVRKRQLESLYALDRSVKQIVDTLKQRHVLDHTVILYSSDNGFLWGEHRLGGKLWPYEESTHVPLVVRTPWATGTTVNAKPILNIDLAPTISAFAGIDPPKHEDGQSFVPFLHERAIPSWRKAYIIEYLGRNQLKVGGPPPYYAVHTRRYLYVEYLNGWRELYDLRTDPWELDNVAQSPQYAQSQGVAPRRAPAARVVAGRDVLDEAAVSRHARTKPLRLEVLVHRELVNLRGRPFHAGRLHRGRDMLPEERVELRARLPEVDHAPAALDRPRRVEQQALRLVGGRIDLGVHRVELLCGHPRQREADSYCHAKPPVVDGNDSRTDRSRRGMWAPPGRSGSARSESA